jgi:hypothetical protein
LGPWGGQYSLEAAMAGHGSEVGNNEYSFQSFLKGHAFSFQSFSQKTGISDERNKDLKLPSREPNDFIASKCFMTPENAKIFQVLQA